MGRGIYGAVVAAHLVGCFTHNKKLMQGTKIFLLPLLFLCVVVGGGYTLPVAAVFALVLGYGGDLFMLKPQVETFLILGMVAFGLGHVGYGVALLQGVKIQAHHLIVSLVLGGAFGLIVYKKLKPYLPAKLTLPVGGYVAIILLLWVRLLQSVYGGHASRRTDFYRESFLYYF